MGEEETEAGGEGKQKQMEMTKKNLIQAGQQEI